MHVNKCYFKCFRYKSSVFYTEEGRINARLALIRLVKEQVEKDCPVPKEEIFDPQPSPPPPQPPSSLFQELKRIRLLSKLLYILYPLLARI